MNRSFHGIILSGLVFVALVLACSEEKPPDKDHYRVLKRQLYDLQQALSNNDQETIENLLIPRLRRDQIVLDSLENFVSPPGSASAFVNFADYQIFHTKTKARIDCRLVSVEGDTSRPVTFTWELVSDSLWLLKRWERDLEPIINDTSQIE